MNKKKQVYLYSNESNYLRIMPVHISVDLTVYTQNITKYNYISRYTQKYNRELFKSIVEISSFYVRHSNLSGKIICLVMAVNSAL